MYTLKNESLNEIPCLQSCKVKSLFNEWKFSHCMATNVLVRWMKIQPLNKDLKVQHPDQGILYNLESKTPVLLSKQEFGMGSYFRRGLTIEQPNHRVLLSNGVLFSYGILQTLQSGLHVPHRISCKCESAHTSIVECVLAPCIPSILNRKCHWF